MNSDPLIPDSRRVKATSINHKPFEASQRRTQQSLRLKFADNLYPQCQERWQLQFGNLNVCLSRAAPITRRATILLYTVVLPYERGYTRHSLRSADLLQEPWIRGHYDTPAWIRYLLSGVSASDLRTLSVTVLFVMLIAAVATALPSGRAVRIEPGVALRQEN
jgi:hypothetical protein